MNEENRDETINIFMNIFDNNSQMIIKIYHNKKSFENFYVLVLVFCVLTLFFIVGAET